MDPARAPPDGNSRSLDSGLAASNSSVLFRDGVPGVASPAKFARHLSCDLSGIHADLMQEPGDRYAHTDEMQTGLRAWNTMLPDRCEMADERLRSLVPAQEQVGPTAGAAAAESRSRAAGWGNHSRRAAGYSAAYVPRSVRVPRRPPPDRRQSQCRANNQHVLVAIRLRIAVIHRMNHGSIEGARPSRQMWKAGISGGHYDRPRKNRASGRVDTPVAISVVNTRGLNPEGWLEAMVSRVLLQVLHELVPCHPGAEVTGNPVARKMR
jgi:hypothetical protein